MRVLCCIVLLFGLLKANDKCNTPMEIAVIVDSSSNLRAGDFSQIQTFINKIGYLFHVSVHASRISVILAGGNNVTIPIDFKASAFEKKGFSKKVNALKSLGGSWNLDKAFVVVNDKVFSLENRLRNYLSHIVIVITNGQQTQGDRNVLVNAAKKLRGKEVSIYAIGVGGGTSLKELQSMTKKESHVYQVHTFKDMVNLAPEVSTDICKANKGTKRICQVPVDLGFIVDSSGSINSDGYNNIKSFLKGMSVYMGFQPAQTHVGVVLYSEVGELASKFGSHLNLRKLFRVIHVLPHRKERTRIDLGLITANISLFSKEGGMREDVKKIAIILTDGQQTVNNVNDLIPLPEAANALKRRGIKLFAVGIGKHVDRNEMLQIVKDDDQLIMLTNFADIEKYMTKIAIATCKEAAGIHIDFRTHVYNVTENERMAVVEIEVASGQIVTPVTVGVTTKPANPDKNNFVEKTIDVTFKPGDKGPKLVEIDVAVNSVDEPPKTFRVTLNSSSPVSLGRPASVNVLPVDDVVVNFTKRVYNVRENETAVIEIIVTSGQVKTPVTVRVTTSPSTAGKGDFVAVSKNIAFQPGETGPKLIEVDIVDDLVHELSEVFTVSLSTSETAVRLGQPTSVNILDDDVPPICGSKNDDCHEFATCTDTGPGSYKCDCNEGYSGDGKTCIVPPICGSENDDCHKFATCTDTGPGSYKCECNEGYSGDGKTCIAVVISFTSQVYDVMENESAVVKIAVTSGEISSPVAVRVNTSPSTARDDDFSLVTKYVTFQPGETGPKSVVIDINDDLIDEPTESFTVSLTSTAPIRLGQPASVNIIDNDVPPICGSENDDCHEFATCTDTGPGNYKCECNKGYSGDGKTCIAVVISFISQVYDVMENESAVVEIAVTSGEITSPVTVRVNTSPSTARDDDFFLVTKYVTFQPGETGPKSVVIGLNDDLIDEPTESFTVSLTSTAPIRLDQPASVNIIDNDVPLICGTENDDCHKFATCTDTDSGNYKCECNEGYSGDGKTCIAVVISFISQVYDVMENESAVVEIAVTSGEITSPVRVRVNTSPSTARDDDFFLVTKFVTFQHGETGPKSVVIGLNDDLIDEPTESFTVSLTSTAPIRLGQPASVNIIDNDVPLICGTENDDCHKFATCTDAGPGSYNCECNEGYSGDGKTCIVPPICGSENDDCHMFATCTDTDSGSYKCECNERYSGDGKTCIAVVISFISQVYDVMENESAVVEIAVTSGEITSPVTVRVNTSPSTARDDDFFLVTKYVTFQPGETGPKSVVIGLNDDLIDEPTESFTVSLTSTAPIRLGQPASVNIIDNDVPLICGTENDDCHKFATCTDAGPGSYNCECNEGYSGDGKTCIVPPICGSENDDCHMFATCTDTDSGSYKCECNEGYSGDGKTCIAVVISFISQVYDVMENESAVVEIAVTSGEITSPVTVRVNTSPSTARDDDFFLVTKYVTFQPGETGPKSVVIGLNDDLIDEPTESFTVSLTSTAPIRLGQPASVNIIDNDVPLICGTENDDCHKFATCTDAGPGSYNCECNEGYSGDGKTCIVPPICGSENDDCHMFATCTDTDSGSYKCECNEGYSGDGKTCIAVVISFISQVYDVMENESAVVEIAVTSGEITSPVTVRVNTSPSTARDDDFFLVTKYVTFQPGETGPKSVVIGLNDDLIDEPTESFTVSLTSTAPIRLGQPASVNIIDNDVPLICGTENDDCHKFATCTDAGPGSYNCECNEGYSGDGKTCIVPPICGSENDDCHMFATCTDTDSGSYKCECNEGYSGDGKTCIAVVISFISQVYDVMENESAVVEIAVTSGEITSPVTVRVNTSPSTARDDDFFLVTKYVTFQPGETGPKSVVIGLNDDLIDEPTESFTVSLTSTAPIRLGQPASVNIIDNDVPLICGTENDDCHKFATCTDTDSGSYKCECNEGYSGDGKTCIAVVISFISQVYDVMENESAVVEIAVTSGEITSPVTVRVNTSPSTARDDDFSLVTKYVTFQPGETGPKSVLIGLNDDLIDEPTESFTVSLTSTAPIRLGQPASVNIIDNDVPKVCGSERDDCHRFATCSDTGPGIYECTCNEGYSGDGKICKGIVIDFTSRVYNVTENENAMVEIELTSGQVTTPISIDVTTRPGTAGEKDFVTVIKTITFQPGETGPISTVIYINDDLINEATETFTVSLTSTAPIRLGQPASVNIIDNDGKGCALDIGFLIDSTGSMRNCNYKKEKDFVKEIAGYFQIASGLRAIRTSVILYSDESVLTKRFNETKTLQEFKADIDKLPLKGGKARLDKAIYMAASTMFTAENGVHTPGVPKILLILNDGAQMPLSRSHSKEISAMFQKSEVRVVVIGVAEADKEQLGKIVASPDDLIMVDQFEDAKEKLVVLSKQFCPTRDDKCKVLRRTVNLRIAGCVSQKPVEIGVCNGYCSSDFQFQRRDDAYQLGCSCCKPMNKVTKTVMLNCSMNTSQAFTIKETTSCVCDSCEDIINKESL